MDKDRLSQREAEYREAVLNGPITPLIIKTCLPLVVYQTITLIFAIFDTAISAHLGEACVSAVAFISQITLFILQWACCGRLRYHSQSLRSGKL